MEVRENHLQPNPESKANPLSRLFYLWVIPFLRLGSRKDLVLEDVYHSLPEDASGKLGDKLEAKWSEEITRAGLENRRPRLWRVLARIMGVSYMLVGLGYCLDELGLRTLQPLALRNFIRTFRDTEENANNPNLVRDQYIYATLVVLSSFGHSLTLQKLIAYVMHSCMKLRLGVSSLVYRKILRLRKSDSEHANVGKLCNLLSSDVGRLDHSLNLLHFLYIAPVQLSIYTYLLYDALGVASFGGVGAVLFFLPVQVLVGRFFMYFRVRIAKRSDERGRFLNEIISGIRLIKMYAWEKPFAGVISKLRKREIKFIRRSLYLRGMYVSVHTIAGKLIPFCALILYVALGNTLTADKAFFSIAIFNTILQAIMNRVPNAASQVGELAASLNRIEDFLLSKDNQKERHVKSYHFQDGIAENGTLSNGNVKPAKEEPHQAPVGPKIVMNNYSASWTEGQETLRNLNVNLSGKKLVMVVGHVGAGKSSFLNALLKELPITNCDDDAGSYCHVQGRKSYASQEAWIFSASVRDNILFGLPMNEERYWKTVKLCCLEDDLKQFSQGDLTLVGERGVALSGGQKARVNLARALYQEADMYLMDDPLSAVDTKVSKRLFHECIRESLKDKMRILVTHQLQYLPMADHIIVLNRDGSIWGQGTYDELKNSDIDFTSLISDEYMNSNLGDVDEVTEDVSGLKRRGSKKPDRETLTAKQNGKHKEEAKRVGSVGIGIYIRYFQTGGSYLIMILLLIGFLVTQVLFNFTDYWLSLWTNEVKEEDNATSTTENVFLKDLVEEGNSNKQNLYAYVYCGLMAGFIFFSIFRSLLFFRYCMKISINLHDGMFESLVRSPVKFFDDNPSGRIMNRFGKDLSAIDEHLPVSFYDFVNVLLMMFGMLAINISANYYVAIPSAMLLVVLWKMRQFYLRSARDLKRIESVCKSPMFSHVTMTVQGLTTIRALDANSRVLAQFENIQDIHTSVYYMLFSASRWFALWLEMSSNIFLAIVTFGFLIISTSVEGGNVGVAITAILSLTGALQWGIRQSAETENHMTSVERVLEYGSLPPEAPLETEDDKQVARNWPTEGRLQFDNLSLAYDDAKENQVLKGVTFSTESQEKLGIVGRTGAGKSSLLTALFRLTEPCKGQIVIDGVPISSLGLHTLRSRISIIPQDPVLFTGSLRYNLDPFNEFPDDQLWSVLREVDLHHAVQNLDAPVADGGANFSVGQRQLVCLARAILRKNRILVLDEVTANCDPFTDILVQQTIRTKFSDCTILTIAHRLQTVLDNDRILVMDKGKVVEFDSPANLREREGSVFYSMLHHHDNNQTGDNANISK